MAAKTPEEFLQAVKRICKAKASDPEAAHSHYDDLVEKLLIDLGYSKGVYEIHNYANKHWWACG
jgi:hypothetical protein